MQPGSHARTRHEANAHQAPRATYGQDFRVAAATKLVISLTSDGMEGKLYSEDTHRPDFAQLEKPVLKSSAPTEWLPNGPGYLPRQAPRRNDYLPDFPGSLKTFSADIIIFRQGPFGWLVANDLPGPGWEYLFCFKAFVSQLRHVNVFFSSLEGLFHAYRSSAFEHCRPNLMVVWEAPNCELPTRLVPIISTLATGKWLFENDEFLSFRRELVIGKEGSVRILVDADGSWSAETHWGNQTD